jgi:peptidoglycan L-alanyl-D-glutamate endopeptidase CwlK
MNTLKEGDSGPDVETLQRKLQEHGFSPGAIDGEFGPGTQAALMAFQKSDGLLADGIVGSQTASALGFDNTVVPTPPGMPAITVSIVSKMFPATPLRNISSNLPSVLAALEAANLTSLPIVLAALATIRAETEGFVPISEFISRFNTSPNGPPFDLYDKRTDLGNRGPTDGADFKGRGYVQLTGRTNYTKYGPLVGVPTLVNNPDQANDPTLAARILAAFIGSKQIAIKQALLENDLAAARRLVNGGSHGLVQFTNAYQTGLGLLT